MPHENAPLLYLGSGDESARDNPIGEPVIHAKELELLGDVATDCVSKVEGASAVSREGVTDKVSNLSCPMPGYEHPDIVRPDEYRPFPEDSGASENVGHHLFGDKAGECRALWYAPLAPLSDCFMRGMNGGHFSGRNNHHSAQMNLMHCHRWIETQVSLQPAMRNRPEEVLHVEVQELEVRAMLGEGRQQSFANRRWSTSAAITRKHELALVEVRKGGEGGSEDNLSCSIYPMKRRDRPLAPAVVLVDHKLLCSRRAGQPRDMRQLLEN